MGNELIRSSRALVNDDSFREKAGKQIAIVGTAGLGVWALAGLLPFITTPMILVAMVLVGVFM